MPTGRVIFFNATKGYGFIEPDDGGQDLFVHASSAAAAGLHSLTSDQSISFDRKPDEHKPDRFEAVNLRV